MTGRWLKIVLVVSLGLNLAVAGVVAGAYLRGHERSDRVVNLPIDGFRGIARAMPRDQRDALHRDWRAARKDITKARRALRGARSDFIAALRAEPFSGDGVRAVLEGQAAEWQSFSARSRDILLARIDSMSPAERAHFADQLEAELNARRKRPGPAND